MKRERNVPRGKCQNRLHVSKSFAHDNCRLDVWKLDEARTSDAKRDRIPTHGRFSFSSIGVREINVLHLQSVRNDRFQGCLDAGAAGYIGGNPAEILFVTPY